MCPNGPFEGPGKGDWRTFGPLARCLRLPDVACGKKDRLWHTYHPEASRSGRTVLGLQDHAVAVRWSSPVVIYEGRRPVKGLLMCHDLCGIGEALERLPVLAPP